MENIPFGLKKIFTEMKIKNAILLIQKCIETSKSKLHLIDKQSGISHNYLLNKFGNLLVSGLETNASIRESNYCMDQAKIWLDTYNIIIPLMKRDEEYSKSDKIFSLDEYKKKKEKESSQKAVEYYARQLMLGEK